MPAPRPGHKQVQFSIPADIDRLIEQEVVDGDSANKSEVAIKALCKHFGLNIVEFNPRQKKSA